MLNETFSVIFKHREMAITNQKPISQTRRTHEVHEQIWDFDLVCLLLSTQNAKDYFKYVEQQQLVDNR